MKFWTYALAVIAGTGFAVILWGCSTANSDAPMLNQEGKHPVGWIELHWSEFEKNPAQCTECHGKNLLDPANTGGISKISCFRTNIGPQPCHPNGPGAHSNDWARPDRHGASAKMAPFLNNGFANCKRCHGQDFAGGSSMVSCLSASSFCHTNSSAPHPASPWRASAGSRYTHTTTNEANAAVCADCHRSAAGTPGCFNNTLCHGPRGTHPNGWADPAQHGTAAKGELTPGVIRGFEKCKECHGTTFNGGTASGCFSSSCHLQANGPHGIPPWTTPASSLTHTNTNTTNAVTCADCHRSNPGTAGCFNGTLCHSGEGVPHAMPYLDPALHGTPAKMDFVYCQGCHGQPGGAGSNPRFNLPVNANLTPNGCENCHADAWAHPSPSSGFTFWMGHRSAGNYTTGCALCHGANLGGGAGPACSSCHTTGSPLTLPRCSSCHGNPPPPPSEANWAHREHDSLPNVTGICATCHNGAGSGTGLHFNGVKNVLFLATYNAESGAATFNTSAKTCSNVSCHGGQTTPHWLLGTINVNAQCGSCHVIGTSQYNSYNSGEHRTHVVEEGIGCLSCHNTLTLANTHFLGLNTQGFTNPPATVGGGTTSVTSYSGGRCTTVCHESEDW